MKTASEYKNKIVDLDRAIAERLAAATSGPDIAASAGAAVVRKTGSPVPFEPGLQLISGASLTPRPVEWVWADWLAGGKIHLLAGAPGTGKTTIAMALAATVTLGGRWPDGSRCKPGNVVIWSGEDDFSDTLIPRLKAAGADISRVHFIGDCTAGKESRPFDPATDTPLLAAAIDQLPDGVAMLIVDPISTAITGDSHKNSEVRRGLQPLADLAAATGAVLLGITHLSKGGQGADPASRVIGSIAFTAVARVVLVAAKVKSDDGKDKRILVRAKSNIGPDQGGFEYGLEQVEALPGIQASRIAWLGAVEGTALELLTDPCEQAEPEEKEASSDAQKMLKAELSCTEWTDSKICSKPLIDHGFSKKQIWSASKKLQVLIQRDGVTRASFWKLPLFQSNANSPERDSKKPDSERDSRDSNFQNVESWNLALESGNLASPEPLSPEESEAF